MKDALSSQRLNDLHPNVRTKFRQFIEECEKAYGYTLRIVQGLRTFSYQHELFIQPHDGKDNDHDGKIDEKDEKVTNADCGQSFHNYGLAVDLCNIKNGQADFAINYAGMAKIGMKYGITWGHAWNDNDHFEMNFGHGSSGWKYFLDLHKNGHVDKEGYVVFAA